ncbi:NYN domain-containing protein [bacterium]|nr:NYN domain-containing protein [bacterium]
MLANIDPVFNLPGKNSADIRIARDVLTDASHTDAADVYILASGDRDFNDVLNTLIKRNLTVIVWGVRGSTSRQLEKNPRPECRVHRRLHQPANPPVAQLQRLRRG